MLLPVNRSCLVLLSLVVAGACAGDAEPNDHPENHPPTVPAVELATDEDVPVEIDLLAGVADPDGDALAVVGVSASGDATLALQGQRVTVTPAPDFHGTVVVSYEVSDGRAARAGRVTLTVRSVNDAPLAVERTLQVHREAEIVLEGRDADGDALTYEIVAPPGHGTLTGTPPRLRYAPEVGFDGTDTITFRTHDGTVGSKPATIHLGVGAEAAPVGVMAEVSGSEDEAFGVVLRASDANRDPLTFTIVTPPAHGTLAGVPPDLVYTPAADFAGVDALTFSVSDGVLSSGPVQVTLEVRPVNDPPVAVSQAVIGTEDTARALTLEGRDIDSTALTFVVTTPPRHGTLSGNGQDRTYTPAANYHGPDSFAFTVSDGLRTSAAATVTFDVTSVNDRPVAASRLRTLAEDGSAAVALAATDADGDALTFALVSPPAHGTLSGTPPALTYTPEANYNGPDAFTYTASDASEASEPATFALQVTEVNDPPVAVDAQVTTPEDTAVSIVLQASDVEGETLRFDVNSAPDDGRFTLNGSILTYTPALNATGTRTFTFVAIDALSVATGTVTIELTAVNDPPTAIDDFVATDPDAPLTFAAAENDFDVEGDAFQISSVDAPAHGDAAVVDGHVVYTPDAGFIGVEEVAYTVVDAHGEASTGHAHVGVGTFPIGAPAETMSLFGGTLSTTQGVPPAISNDGRFVAFVSSLALVDSDTNGVDDVYLRDRGTRTLSRVSVASGGGEGNGPSSQPRVSADGRYIVFASSATNLVAGDTNGVSDVFRHDRVSRTTVRISVASAGGQASGASVAPDISDDGNLVVYFSSAFELVPNDANGALDVFVRDVTAGMTERISVSSSGSDADLSSSEPAISGDGRFVAFSSIATNLVTGDSNNLSDVFVRDRVARITTRVSVSTTGGQADRQANRASLSRDGRFVSFLSDATNLSPGTTFGTQLYVRDVTAQTTTRPAQSNQSIVWGRLSGDGRYVTQFSVAGVIIRDRFAGITLAPPGASAWFWPQLSGNGRYLVFLQRQLGGSVTVVPNSL